MANRLSTIATRTGDDGTTGLGDGTRVDKAGLRVAAMGDIDELNSHIGLLLTEALDDPLRNDLIDIQHDLFDLGAELCLPGQTLLPEARVAGLDERLAHYNALLPRLAEFILPGARAPRRRRMYAARFAGAPSAGSWPWRPPSRSARMCANIRNRLSDLLFVLARTLYRAAGGGEPHGSRAGAFLDPHMWRRWMKNAVPATVLAFATGAPALAAVNPANPPALTCHRGSPCWRRTISPCAATKNSSAGARCCRHGAARRPRPRARRVQRAGAAHRWI